MKTWQTIVLGPILGMAFFLGVIGAITLVEANAHDEETACWEKEGESVSYIAGTSDGLFACGHEKVIRGHKHVFALRCRKLVPCEDFR